MIVVDGDPNSDGNPEDAKIDGNVLLTGKYASDGNPLFNTDDEIIKHDGMGGQGVYPIPNVNPGWVEKLGISWNLTSEQRDPITSFNQLNNQPLQANNNDDSTRNDVNSESIQPQQESTTSQLIEEKLSELQQPSVSQAIDPNMTSEQRDPITSFNQLNNQPLQANNNDDSTRNDVNSESIQPQQESTTSQLIEEKLSELQQPSVSQAIDPNMTSEQRDSITSFNQLNNQPLQENNNDDSTRNDVNSESIQPQQESTTSQLIEEKLSELQQPSVSQAIDPNMTSEQAQAPSLEKLNNIISLLPVPSP